MLLYSRYAVQGITLVGHGDFVCLSLSFQCSGHEELMQTSPPVSPRELGHYVTRNPLGLASAGHLRER